MKIDLIIGGLDKLLMENSYSATTIQTYHRYWSKIKTFLIDHYGSDDYSPELGLKYLESEYGLLNKLDSAALKQSDIQKFRNVHMLDDYMLHGVLIRRYTASKNPIKLNSYFGLFFEKFKTYLENCDYSYSTREHYKSTSKVFFDYLTQRGINDLKNIDLAICNDFIKTFSGYSFKMIEQLVCGLRSLLKFLYNENLIETEISSRIHMPNISKSAKIPSVWSAEELDKLISVIDRTSPIGKRDYAIILIACVLGLRSGDIKKLKFSNIDWVNKRISLVQSKTKKPLILPLPDAVGWAIIDYIKNGRPNFKDSEYIFIKHMPPFDNYGENARLYEIIGRYLRKAGLYENRKHKIGMHSLRHSAASLLLEEGVQLPVITQILGHSSVDITAVYLKTDLNKLKECVLPLDFEGAYEGI